MLDAGRIPRRRDRHDLFIRRRPNARLLDNQGRHDTACLLRAVSRTNSLQPSTEAAHGRRAPMFSFVLSTLRQGKHRRRGKGWLCPSVRSSFAAHPIDHRHADRSIGRTPTSPEPSRVACARVQRRADGRRCGARIQRTSSSTEERVFHAPRPSNLAIVGVPLRMRGSAQDLARDQRTRDLDSPSNSTARSNWGTWRSSRGKPCLANLKKY